MYVGDWASCYLALDNDVDPGPIDAIAQLKDRLAGCDRGASVALSWTAVLGRAAIAAVTR